MESRKIMKIFRAIVNGLRDKKRYEPIAEESISMTEEIEEY